MRSGRISTRFWNQAICRFRTVDMSFEFLPGEDHSSFEVTHLVSGAPLIVRMLEERKAQCVCIVSSPISSYRRHAHVVDYPARSESGTRRT